MRNTLIAAVTLTALTATGAIAGCAEDILKVETWKIEPIDHDTNRLTVNFAFTGDKPIRMMDASAGFEDALGKHIASFGLDRDYSLSTGDAIQTSVVGVRTHSNGSWTYTLMM